MNNFEQKINKLKWERWLERPFSAFLLSLFEDSGLKQSFKEIGIPDVEMKAQLFQFGFWYLNQDAMEEMDKQIEKYLDSHDMFDITNQLDKYKKESIKKIKQLIKSRSIVEERFKQVFDILKHCCTYILLAHGIESYYNRKLKEEVPKYIKADIDKFTGDASFPKKKNAHAYFEEMLRNGASAEKIIKKYGWLKTRDGFSEGFNVDDIERIRKDLVPAKSHLKVKIPKQLKELFNQIKELVFFRTARTDVFYELLFRFRPIMKELSDKYQIEFNDLRYYRAKSFINGNPERYEPLLSFAYLDGEVVFQNRPILNEEKLSENMEIRGSIAYKGKVQGVVKIVKTVDEISKVKDGDILVTQMTFPAFISAMMKASAFVTDEGGITCHAAIIAREMHKPCIIGTKNATRLLKDGDLVEVDADNGIVKIIN